MPKGTKQQQNARVISNQSSLLHHFNGPSITSSELVRATGMPSAKVFFCLADLSRQGYITVSRPESHARGRPPLVWTLKISKEELLRLLSQGKR